MKKGLTTIYTLVLILALVFIFGGSKSAYAISPADADKSPEVKVNEIMTDKLGGKGDVKWYKVNVSERGYFRVTLGPNAEADVDDISWGWNCSLYKKGDLTGEIFKLDHVTTKEAMMWMAYKPDTFYIKIEHNADYNQTMLAKAPFDLMVEFNKTDFWEQEDNNKNVIANSINVNTTYTGITNVDDDNDWYKFTISEGGVATLSLGPELNLSDMERIKWGWNMSIYTADLKSEVCKLEGITAPTTSKEKYNLKPGSYYVKIYPNNSGYFAPDRQFYTFSVNFNGYSQAIQKEKVKILKPKAAKKKATIKWKKISYASGYEIYRSTKAKKGFKKIATVKGSKSSYVSKKLKSKKKYYYKVRAFVKVGNKKFYSQYSAVKNVKAR